MKLSTHLEKGSVKPEGPTRRNVLAALASMATGAMLPATADACEAVPGTPPLRAMIQGRSYEIPTAAASSDTLVPILGSPYRARMVGITETVTVTVPPKKKGELPQVLTDTGQNPYIEVVDAEGNVVFSRRVHVFRGGCIGIEWGPETPRKK